MGSRSWKRRLSAQPAETAAEPALRELDAPADVSLRALRKH